MGPADFIENYPLKEPLQQPNSNNEMAHNKHRSLRMGNVNGNGFHYQLEMIKMTAPKSLPRGQKEMLHVVVIYMWFDGGSVWMATCSAKISHFLQRLMD